MRIFLTLTLIFITFIASAQDNIAKLEVKYTMTHAIDSLNKKNVQYIDMTLLCNETKSVYFDRNDQVFNDFLIAQSKNKVGNKITLGALPPYPKARGKVFKNENMITAILPIGQDLYSFEEPKLNWVLLPDKKMITGMECFSAKVITDTGHTFTAWYTEKYPFSEGPFRFKGLPGLILEIYNQNHTIHIVATEIKKSTEMLPTGTLSNIIYLKDKEKFLRGRKIYLENPNMNTFKSDIIISDNLGTDYTKIMKKQANSANNFLD